MVNSSLLFPGDFWVYFFHLHCFSDSLPFLYFLRSERCRDSELGDSRCSRERNDVSDVIGARSEHDKPLEAQPESSVGDRTVSAQVDIVAVVVDVEPLLPDGILELRLSLLPLRSSDEFSDLLSEAEGGRN